MANPFLKLDGKYYVRHQAAVDAGMTDKCLYNRSNRNPEKWDIIRDPIAANRNLYGWDELKQSDRDLIATHYNSTPADYLAIQPIRDMIVRDDKAEAFYLDYTYEINGKAQHLRPEWVESYTRNASLLNMLRRATADKAKIKKQFGMKLMPWFEKVGELIKQDGYSLPTNYRGLIGRNNSVLKRYIENGYSALIDGRVGQMNAAKVKGDLAKDFLIELFKHPNQYDDAYICQVYNQYARKNGLEEVGVNTISNWRHKFKFEITAYREGWAKSNAEYALKIHRLAPTMPTFVWEGDDNHLDLWFEDDKVALKTHRIRGYIVADSVGGKPYPLGWAFSEGGITSATVKTAFLMAIHHIFELTGGWYLPHQIIVDNGGLTDEMQEYMKGIAPDFFKVKVGSKNRGWIENFFAHPDWARSLKSDPRGLPSVNYTGNNLSAKNRGVNWEALTIAKRQHRLPKWSEANAYISAHMERMRSMPIGYRKGAPSRQQLWLQAWKKMPEDRKRPMSRMQILLKAGLEHRHPKTGVLLENTITGSGIEPTIIGQTYHYAVPAAFRLENVGRKVRTIYDPFDMNTVLCAGESLQFIANHITPVAGCTQDMKKGGREFLNRLLKEKEEDVKKIAGLHQKRLENLWAHGIDVESALGMASVGMAPKQLKIEAEEEWQMEQAESVKIPLIPAETSNDKTDYQKALSSL